MKKSSSFFTLSAYEEFIKNCIILKVKDYKFFNSGLIMRHDVDSSIDFAYELSRIERTNGVFTSYFFLTSSEFYNIFSKSYSKMIKRMHDDGFEIGLHFDPTIYENQTDDLLKEKFTQELNYFQNFFGFKVYSFSMHNPSENGFFEPKEDIVNTYNPMLFNDESYISDSLYSFRNKDPYHFKELSKKKRVQFLTHPIHFFNNGETNFEISTKVMINNFATKYKTLMDNALLNKKD